MPHFHRNDTAGQAATCMVDQITGNQIQMTFADLGADLTALRTGAPQGIVDAGVTNIGHSERNRPIHAIRIGRNQNHRDVFIGGCHHAREWISVEVPYMLAAYLIAQYGTDAQVTAIVDGLSIWVVPMVNPDGHEQSVTQNRYWRKNNPNAGNPVDPNRNYNAPGWGTVTWGCSNDPASDAYCGPAAASTREVQNVQNLLTGQTVGGVNFRASLDFHNFCQYACYPWGYRHDQAHGASNAMATTFVNGMPAHQQYQPVQAALLYHVLFPHNVTQDQSHVPGGLYDFVAHQLNVPALTVELDPAFSDPRGFVLGEGDIQPQFDKVRDAILAFLAAV